MIRNYITVAWRSLQRSKVHSFINISGLALAIATCILISLFIFDELTFDRFHSKSKRIYRVYAMEDYGENQKFFYTTTPFPMGPALKVNLPEVEATMRLNFIGSQVRLGDKNLSESIAIVGASFFELFDFELVKGDKTTALQQQSNVLLTESTAKRFFGDQDPIEQPIAIQIGDQFEEFTVKGILKDPPKNSSISFKILISDLNYTRLYSPNTLTSAWFNITPETYVLLKEGVEVASVIRKFPTLFKSLLGEDFEKSKYVVGLQPLTSIHLDTFFPAGIAPVSDPKYSYILGAIALLILFVACINFVTLSIGRSLKRSKEVGIRKVAGAQRKQLVIQFLSEALIITALSLMLGLLLAVLCLPLFNTLSGKTLIVSIDAFTVGVTFLLIIIIGVFAGSYPAFVLSSFRPISVLKGAVSNGNNKQTLRKILVGVQLVLSIFLISSTLLMKKQLSFLQSKNLGFDRDQLAVVQLNVTGNRLRERIPNGFVKAEQFKTELAKFPQIVSACGSSHDFGTGAWMNLGFTDDKGIYQTFSYNTVDEDYLTTLKIELHSGRNFSKEIPSDSRRAIIVNEAFVEVYGWSDPIGKRIPGKNFEDHEIIGVVKDFNYSSLYTKVEPLVLSMTPSFIFPGIENINLETSADPKLIIRLGEGNAAETIKGIEEVWDKLAGDEEFSLSFVEAALDAQYRTDQNLGKMISIATLLAMLIGSLGLYGLASLAMQNRVKEISIRKVVGATEGSLMMLLAKDYVVLILISIACSVPFTVYLMKEWLSSFEYRVPISVDVFVISGVLSLGIAIVTISYHAVKTAWSQPARTLKCE
jgi:putative ABC transport system permease protein